MKKRTLENFGAAVLLTGIAIAGEPSKICISPPDVRITAAGGNPSEAVRNTFAEYLTGPSIQAVNLTARLASQVAEEAKQAGCEAVLHVTVTQKRAGGPGFLNRTLANAGMSAATYIPAGGSAATGIARSVGMSGVWTVAQLASNVKAKDEIRLEYRVDPVREGGASTSGSLHAAAQSDGDDVITPLIAKSAEAVLAAVRRAER